MGFIFGIFEAIISLTLGCLKIVWTLLGIVWTLVTAPFKFLAIKIKTNMKRRY